MQSHAIGMKANKHGPEARPMTESGQKNTNIFVCPHNLRIG